MKAFAVLLMLSFASGAQAAEAFLPGLEDMPLMPGLAADEPLVFDTPEGRIVEVRAASATAALPRVKAYYRTVLPQLGWTPAGGDAYVREQEALRLDVTETEGRVEAVFSLSPR